MRMKWAERSEFDCKETEWAERSEFDCKETEKVVWEGLEEFLEKHPQMV